MSKLAKETIEKNTILIYPPDHIMGTGGYLYDNELVYDPVLGREVWKLKYPKSDATSTNFACYAKQ